MACAHNPNTPSNHSRPDRMSICTHDAKGACVCICDSTKVVWGTTWGSHGASMLYQTTQDDKVDHPGPGGPGLLNWTHRVVFNPTSDRMTLVVTPGGSWCLIMKSYIWAHHGAFLEEMGASGDFWYGWTGAASRNAGWKGRPGGHIGQYPHPIPSRFPIIHTAQRSRTKVQAKVEDEQRRFRRGERSKQRS